MSITISFCSYNILHIDVDIFMNKVYYLIHAYDVVTNHSTSAQRYSLNELLFIVRYYTLLNFQLIPPLTI